MLGMIEYLREINTKFANSDGAPLNVATRKVLLLAIASLYDFINFWWLSRATG